MFKHVLNIYKHAIFQQQKSPLSRICVLTPTPGKICMHAIYPRISVDILSISQMTFTWELFLPTHIARHGTGSLLQNLRGHSCNQML